MTQDKEFMEMAIEVAREGVKKGQTPFGAVIVKDGQVIAKAHNTVWKDSDPTAHAEVNALRKAGKKEGIDLSGAIIYSTTEPCPMCFSAIHWAKIGGIVYGTSIEDAKKAGFSELSISNEDMARAGKSKVKVLRKGVLRTENLALFKAWADKSGKPY